MISFVPQGLSGMGWLHAENVHAQHARDHNRFSSIPVMKKRKEGEKKKKTHLHSVCKYAKDAANIFECSQRAPTSVHTCVRVCYKLVYL